MRVNKMKRQRLLVNVKIGIVKQLYKDHQITDSQYHFLMKKYSQQKQ